MAWGNTLKCQTGECIFLKRFWKELNGGRVQHLNTTVTQILDKYAKKWKQMAAHDGKFLDDFSTL